MSKYLNFIFTSLMFLFSVSAAWADDTYKSVEIIKSPQGVREVFATDMKDNRVRIGEIEIWKKGTLLFHWGKGTPEQAASWDAAGKISPELLNRLKAEHSGNMGSGFYASKNPVDSYNYGNVLVVIELPRDTEIIKADAYAPNGNGRAWNEIIEKAGVTGATHNRADTWVNLRDADVLTKEFVMTPERIEKLKPHGGFAIGELRNFGSYHPEYAETKWYKREVALAERTAKIIQEKNSKFIVTLRKMLRKGTYNADGLIMTSMMGYEGPLPADILKLAIERHEAFMGTAGIAGENIATAIDLGLTGTTEKGMRYALSSFARLTVEEQVFHLQKAAAFWGENLPRAISEKIESLNTLGKWQPVPICNAAFGP